VLLVNLDYLDKSTKKAKGLHRYISKAVKGEDVNDRSLRIV
jgi:alpha-1,3-mannosyltransferase